MNTILELITLLTTSVIKREYEEESVKVAYTGPNLRVFVEDDYIDLVKGTEVTLPRWLAKLLVEKGFAKITEQQLDDRILARINFNEIRASSSGGLKFEKLQGCFYLRIKDEVLSLLNTIYSEKGNIDKIQQILQSMNKLVGSSKDLYKTRLSKILNIVTIEVGPEILANLSEEEKELYNSLKTILEVFNKELFEVKQRE